KQADEQFATLYGIARELVGVLDAAALLVWLESPTDWHHLKELAGDKTLIIASDAKEEVSGAAKAGLPVILVTESEAPIQERLGQVMLQCIAEEILSPGAGVV